MTAASVPDVGCVPSPRSLDASVAGFYKLVLLYGCAASVLNAGRVPSPCSLDDSVAGFSTLALPPPCAMQGGASLTVQPLSSKDLYAVCALARCAVRLLCWRQPRFSRCGAAVHVQLLSILGVGCSPSPCALARCAARLLCSWFRLRFSRCSAALCAATVYFRRLMFSVAVCAPSLDALPGFYADFNCHALLALQCCFVCSHCLLSAPAVLRRRVCALARCAVRLLCWHQLRFSRCSAAVCSCCLPSASAVLRRRVLSLDAPPGF